jgi:hypothetical protein
MKRHFFIAVAATLVIGLQGCASPAAGEPSTSADPSAGGSSASAAASPSPLASAEPTPLDPAFSCDAALEGGEDGHAHLTDIEVTTRDGFDRTTFTYDGDSIPGYTVESAHAPFTHDPSGLPMDVAGAQVFRIAVHGGTKYTDDYVSTYYGPINFEPGYEQIVQLVESGDFEATNIWYLGTSGGECLRAFYATDPTRLIIDVQH